MASVVAATTSGDQMLLPERLMHHLALVSVPENTDAAFKQIFTVLMQPLTKLAGQQIIENVILSSIMLYRTVCQLFKPTPAHSHYVFGPRDLSKIFQGMLLVMKNAQTGEQSFR